MDTLLALFSFPLPFDERAGILAIALIADSIIGDPPWLWRRVPHPVVLFGWVIHWADGWLNPPAGSTKTRWRRRYKAKTRRILGILTVLRLLAITYGTGWGIEVAINSLETTTASHLIPLAIEFTLVTILLAGGSLAAHVHPVAQALDAGNLPLARRAISHIVGRNPNTLDAPAISRAAIETTAENLSDGVVAPALFGGRHPSHAGV